MNSVYMSGYEKLETLYENNLTIVFRAINKKGDTYLIKALKNSSSSEEQTSRLEYEYKLLKELGSPGIIRAIDLIKDDKQYFILMEDAGGIHLLNAQMINSIRNEALEITAVSLIAILEICISMAEIIRKIHDSNLIHKDINPKNFLIYSDSPDVKIIDFSFAAKTDQIRGELQNVKMLEEQLPYISPEQTGRINLSIDYRTDFYSFGVTMYEIFTGRRPFESNDPLELVHSIIARIPVQPCIINSKIPKGISDMIMKLMNKAPDERYQSSIGIINDLNSCIEELRSTGMLKNFKPGMNDVSLRFRIKQKLYGIDSERMVMNRLYSRVAAGESQLLLIGGYAGAGKTSLVQEIYRPITDNGGFFASGKAEQFQNNTPYFVVIQIIKDLVWTLMQSSDSELNEWKNSFEKEFNGNGKLITDMVPELISIIGEQSKINELGLTESMNRYLNALGSFFKVFAQKDHPLVIFLDDLQWSDQSSIEFIKYVHLRDDFESLLIIGCYRENELKEGHQLYDLLEELKGSENAINYYVRPLEEKYIVEMISDTLNCMASEAEALASLIYRKTKGNPFFVRKMLGYLHDKKLIHFNIKINKWVWDINEIESIDISDNIVELIISQREALKPETQEKLAVAALIGSTFDIGTLSGVFEIPLPAAALILQDAIKSEIIIPDNEQYDMLIMMKREDKRIGFRFTHDRVQQACAALLDENRQKLFHLKIGRLMLANTDESMLEERSMDILRHLNEGLGEIKDIYERRDIAKLNYLACARARSASAFKQAFQYIDNSIRLLPKAAWESDYCFTFSVVKAHAECAYLNHDYALADDHAKLLMQYAKTPEEKAEIRLMQSLLYGFLGEFDKALDCAVQGLQLLNYKASDDPSLFDVGIQFARFKLTISGKETEELLRIPRMEDRRIQLILQLFNAMNRIAFICGRINLFFVNTLKAVILTVKHGYSKEAASIYSALIVTLAVFGDFRGANKFGRLSMILCEDEERAEWRGSIYNSYAFFGHGWSSSWCNMHEWFEKAFADALKYGEYYSLALAGAFMYAFKPDIDLRTLIQKSMKQLPVLKQIDNKFGFYMFFLLINRWLNYSGQTDKLYSLNISVETYKLNKNLGVVCSEDEYMENMHKMDSQSGLGMYYKEKMYIHYLYDDYKGAMEHLKESDKYLKYHTGNPYIVECRLCSFLVTAANMPDMSIDEKRKARRRLNKEYKEIRALAKYCPVNFKHLQYLMEAELARLDQKPYKAVEFYDLAIQYARDNGFIRDEGLVNELSAKMFIELGKENQAAYYIGEAYKGYKKWGAFAKTSQMEQKYAHYLQIEHSTVKKASLEDFDLMSLAKASQMISKETYLPDMLQEIMKAIAENYGAERALVLLQDEKAWKLEAEYDSNAAGQRIVKSIPLEESGNILSIAVVNSCIHSGETVLLSNAAAVGTFRTDLYIQMNKIRSLLCIPFKVQGEMTGILYMENNLSPDVFTNERIHVLELLLTQFSTTIKNVKLLSDLLMTTEKLHESNEEVLRSEIAFLQAQIKPHFLYNAINTVSAFSLDEPEMTRELLANLSHFLRGSFDFKNRDKLVTLSKELELVEAYLFIEKARFGDRLRVVYDIDENIECMLPPLVLQPLVENATQHGLSGRKHGGTVRITVKDAGSFVNISVEDDGAGMEEVLFTKLLEGTPGERKGVALKNINLRLNRMYGQGLKMERVETGGTRIMINIPK